MDDLLSNDEIDALLGGDDEEPEIGDETGDDFELVDFTNAHNKTLMSFPGFNSLNEIFAMESGNSLSGFLRRRLSITTRAPKLMTYGDYISNMEYPTSFNLIEFSNQHSMAFIQLSSDLLYVFIDYLFGNVYTEEIKTSEQFGKMEDQITTRVMDTVLKVFADVWRDIEIFDYIVLQSMLKPNPINLLNETDRMLICGYNIHLEKKQLYFELALETSLLERLKPAIQHSNMRNVNIKEDRLWRRGLNENVMEVEFELETRFPNMQIKFDELINLKVGDVVGLDNPNFVNVFLDEMHVYTANCGSSKGSRVIEILDVIKF